MPLNISLKIIPDSFIQAVTSLDLDVKRHLLDIIEQQIFEAEEASYEEDVDTKAEIDAVKLECQQGEFTPLLSEPYWKKNGSLLKKTQSGNTCN